MLLNPAASIASGLPVDYPEAVRARPAPGGAWRPLVAGLATLAIVGAVLWIVRKDLLAVGLMVLGLLALSGGAGFVLAPLMRRRAGGPDPGPPLLTRPSFV